MEHYLKVGKGESYANVDYRKIRILPAELFSKLAYGYKSHTGRELLLDIKTFITQHLPWKTEIETNLFSATSEAVHIYIPRGEHFVTQFIKVEKLLNNEFKVWHQYCVPTLFSLVKQKFNLLSLLFYWGKHGHQTIYHLPHMIELLQKN